MKRGVRRRADGCREGGGPSTQRRRRNGGGGDRAGWSAEAGAFVPSNTSTGLHRAALTEAEVIGIPIVQPLYLPQVQR